MSKLCSFVFNDSVSNGGIHRSVEVDFGDVMGVYSLNFSFNQQYLVAGCGNGAIQVISVLVICHTQYKRNWHE